MAVRGQDSHERECPRVHVSELDPTDSIRQRRAHSAGQQTRPSAGSAARSWEQESLRLQVAQRHSRPTFHSLVETAKRHDVDRLATSSNCTRVQPGRDPAALATAGLIRIRAALARLTARLKMG
jgi:hypothetical protein